MMLVVPSITTLQGQLEADALKMGLTVLNLNKVTLTAIAPERFSLRVTMSFCLLFVCPIGHRSDTSIYPAKSWNKHIPAIPKMKSWNGHILVHLSFNILI